MTAPHPAPGVRPWTYGPPRTLASTRIFELRERTCTSATHPDKSGPLVYLDCPDWVSIIATTTDDRLVLVEQWRVGTLSVTLELPGGMIDEGEDPAAAAARELGEETGYAPAPGAPPPRVIGRFSANAPMMTNWVHVVRIEGVTPTGARDFDPMEELATRLVRPADIDGLIRDGTLHHSIALAALLRWRIDDHR